MGLAGQTAIVTGAGKGFGRAIALRLAQDSAGVVAADIQAASAEETAALIRTAGGEATSCTVDVASAGSVEAMVRCALAQGHGRVDILVNNAGIWKSTPTEETTEADWDRVLAVNLRGPFLLCRAVLPGMRARRRGQIVNISSESGLNHYEGDGAYGLSKHALNDFGEYLQREHQAYNIRVNTICPGMVVSEMTAGAAGLDHSKCLYPEDIADLAIWLLQRRPNVKIGTPILIQTMENPWE
jgi:meso-butanediol dehydrogenase/(S,S)-butanediol dehydrogenase/diacetyl reductase